MCLQKDRAFNEGRVLLRPSGTEPLVRVMVEARWRPRPIKVAARLAAVVEGLRSGKWGADAADRGTRRFTPRGNVGICAGLLGVTGERPPARTVTVP